MASVSAVGSSASDIRTDFMKLFVTQLQHQDPMEPLDNGELATQLAQLSSLEQLENMGGTFRDVLASQQRLQAMTMIGKEIEFTPQGRTDVFVGRVDSVKVYDEGTRLTVGQFEIDLEAVQSVRN
jgi:flagellar hook assembly protein FlgD